MFRLDLINPNKKLRMFERLLTPFAYYYYKVESSLSTAKHVRTLRRMRRYYV